MAKNGSEQKLIFWKNISSDLALVLRNYALWVNENDEIWSVVAFHEKIFRVPKLRFLAGPASLLDEVNRGTQNWSVRAVTTSNQSISVTFQTFRPFLVIWGHFRPFLAILAPNSKLWQTSHVTTQNDRKRSRNRMKMVSDVIFKTFRPFLVIWGLFRPFLANFGPKFKIVLNWSCDHSKWLQEKQKSNGDGFGWHFLDIQANFGHLGHFSAIFGQFLP